MSNRNDRRCNERRSKPVGHAARREFRKSHTPFPTYTILYTLQLGYCAKRTLDSQRRREILTEEHRTTSANRNGLPLPQPQSNVDASNGLHDGRNNTTQWIRSITTNTIIEGLRERTEYIDIFLFSAHYSIMFCFRWSVYWWKGSVRF